jgi:hypothetical protein
MESSVAPLVLLLFLGILWLVPLLSVLFSSKTSGSEKLAWILAIIFISWGAWIFYLLLAPLKKKDNRK